MAWIPQVSAQAVVIGIIVFVIPVPAVVYAIAYVGYSYWMDKRGGDNINHSAHLFGAAYGVLFMLATQPGVVPNFIRQLGLG